MSFSRYSKLFGHDKKSIIKVLTISLFFVGLTAAALFAYQQLAKPALPVISKDNAIAIAYKAGNWNKQTLEDKHTDATLVHVKANGFSFIVDQGTLQETTTLYQNLYPNYENQYLWIVGINASNNNDWVYTIDAATGKIVSPP